LQGSRASVHGLRSCSIDYALSTDLSYACRRRDAAIFVAFSHKHLPDQTGVDEACAGLDAAAVHWMREQFSSPSDQGKCDRSTAETNLVHGDIFTSAQICIHHICKSLIDQNVLFFGMLEKLYRAAKHKFLQQLTGFKSCHPDSTFWSQIQNS
jgi:hypothetical protein